MGWWLALSPQEEGSLFASWGLLVLSLHVLPDLNWFSWYSSFLPTSENMHVRLDSDSKLTAGVSVSMPGYLSHVPLCWPCDGLAACPAFFLCQSDRFSLIEI